MCRKREAQGLCLICFSLGMLTGHCIGRWLLCMAVSIGLMALGAVLLKRK